MLTGFLVPVQVKHTIEEEWSYIPVGGPLPLGDQPVTAFGAAANLVHPATGYSIARSLREAPALAAEMAAILRRDLPVRETARQVWGALWPAEKRRQVCFHALKLPYTWTCAQADCCIFAIKLLARLDLRDTNHFYSTFFRLRDSFWHGFLYQKLCHACRRRFMCLAWSCWRGWTCGTPTPSSAHSSSCQISTGAASCPAA